MYFWMLWEKLLPRGEDLQHWLQRGKQKMDLRLPEPQSHLEGEQKEPGPAEMKWKCKIKPGLVCACWDAGGSSASPAEPLTSGAESPLSQLGDSFPAAVDLPKGGRASCAHPSTAGVLHHPQVSPDLLVPLDATSPSCRVWLELPRCDTAVAHGQCLCAWLLAPCSTF